MITLLACIKQARWPDDGPLSIFPGVDVSEEKRRVEKKSPPATLVELPTLPPPFLEDVIRLIGVPRTLHSDVSSSSFVFHNFNLFFSAAARYFSFLFFGRHLTHPNKQFHKAINAIPDVDVKIVNAAPDKVDISLSRKNPALTPDFRIYAPKFPKSQTEGWFIILGDPNSGAIYALKRVGWPPLRTHKARTGQSGLKPTVKTSLLLPPGFQAGMSLTAIVLSDSYQLDIRRLFKISPDTIVQVPERVEK